MGLHETDKFAVAEKFGSGIIQDSISSLARDFHLWVIAGTIPVQTSGKRVRAACLVFDDKGICAARYDKIHLFDVRVSDNEAHQESAAIERGDTAIVVDTPIGRVGLSVCYDLRFPELYSALSTNCDLIINIANWPSKRLNHWNTLLKARAIENQISIDLHRVKSPYFIVK